MSIQGIVRHLNLVGNPEPQPEPFLTAEQREKWRIFVEATTTQDERATALAQQQADAETEYKNSFEGRTEKFREGEPPTDLKAKTSGLSPARSRLVLFYAWIDRERAELTRLIEARESFFDALEIPRVEQSKLERIKASDNSKYLEWILAGSAKLAMPSIDAFRRAQAETKLAEATAEAETARAGLVGIDERIAFQEGVIRILEARRDAFVTAVVEGIASVVR